MLNNNFNKSLTIPTSMWTEPNHAGPNHTSSTQNSTQQSDIPESSNSRNSPPSNPTKNVPRSFLYTDTIINEGVNACQRSIIGKFITDKPIHVNSIQSGLENIWGSPPGLKIQVLEGKILQFFMQDSYDQDRILLGNPWIFHNAWLVVKPWDRETDFHTIDFEHVPVWIQLWGLPPQCKTKQMGISIGALLGKVKASEFYEYPGKKLIIKIKVAIDTRNPITSGIHIGNPKDGTSWIDFRFEKLPQFCFKCGMIGHDDKLCRNQAMELGTLAPLGPWIRSTQYGKRNMEEKDRKYYSNPSHGKDFGHTSPTVPADLLEKLAAMKVQAETGNKSNQQQNQQYKAKKPENMSEVHIQQEAMTKKAHRITQSMDDNAMETDVTLITQDHILQAKRQKMEENLRVGTARQASPKR
jgi:hypothetical protein